MFVLAPFVISRLAAEEAKTEMTDEIYSLVLRGCVSKGACYQLCCVKF